MLVWCVLVNITPASWRQQTLSVSELSHVQSAGQGEKKQESEEEGGGRQEMPEIVVIVEVTEAALFVLIS